VWRVRPDSRRWEQLGQTAYPQLVQMVVEALHAHRPRHLKKSNSKNNGPSMRLNYPIWRDVYSKGILFCLARKKSAVPASSLPNDAVEHEYR
jgi:hypothetical protein